jgi:hypothetical protein
MKKFLLLFILFTCQIHAEWRDTWIQAIEYEESKDYVNAEKFYTNAIREMEKSGDIQARPYIDRSRLYLLVNMDEQCISDTDKAIKLNLIGEDHKTAYVTRCLVYVKLENYKEYYKNFNIVKENHLNPIIEYTDTKIIIRNIPECECYKKMMQNYMIKSGQCESEADFKILPNMWVIKKKAIVDSATAINGCKCRCDRAFFLANCWCGKTFKRPDCQWLCLFTVEALKEGCYWCCRNGNFYQDCTEPFANIFDAMEDMCIGEFDCN